jgi:hypoxanthine phosphoribosyltransferase
MKVLVKDKYFEPYLLRAEVEARIEVLAQMLNEEYASKTPLFLSILNGSFMFAAALMSRMQIPCEVSFVKLKSYVGDHSSGKVTTMLGLEQSLAGRHVILLEDIIDTGRTLYQFLPSLEEHGLASLKICALLHKPQATEYPIGIDYLGFSVPNHFLVGWGLDYDGLGRNLMDICKTV